MSDKIVFKYLNDKNFSILKSESNIYFIEYRDDKYAQIRLHKNGTCFIYWSLIDEISDFFSLGDFDSQSIIGRWVENTLQIEVISAQKVSGFRAGPLGNTLQIEVTSTESKGYKFDVILGHTLQIEVTSTQQFFVQKNFQLGNTLQTEVTSTHRTGTEHWGGLQIPYELRDI